VSGDELSTAQTISADGAEGSNAQSDRFEFDPVMIDAVVQIKRGEYLAARGKGADEEFDVLERATKSAMVGIRKRVGIMASGDGTGSIATLTANPTTTSFPIEASLCNRLKAGDRIFAATAASGGSLVNSGISTRVVAAEGGTVVCADDVAAAGWLSTHHIFFKGMRGTTQVPLGIFAFAPSTAPLVGDSFAGTNRYGKPWLGGYRFNATGYDTSTALIAAASMMAANDQKPTKVLVSFKSWELLTADKDATKIVGTNLGKYEIGFDSVIVHGAAGGKIEAIPSSFFKPGQALLLSDEDKEELPYIVCADDLINIDDVGAPEGIRQRDASSNYELRAFLFGQIVAPAPATLCHVFNLPTA
jgi:hypothetical protein